MIQYDLITSLSLKIYILVYWFYITELVKLIAQIFCSSCTLLCKRKLHGHVRLRLVHYLCTETVHTHMSSITYTRMFVGVCVHVCPCVYVRSPLILY